jgi:phenylalanyl-tRNA synthetase beta chain
VAKIVLNNQPIGLIYKLHPKAQEDFDIDTTFIAEIKFDKLSDEVIKADPISKYQHSKRDISIIAPKELEYDKIRQTIKELDIPQIVQFNLIDVYSDESLADKESLTIRFVLQSDNQTLTEEMINNIMDSILEALKTKLDIGIR